MPGNYPTVALIVEDIKQFPGEGEILWIRLVSVVVAVGTLSTFLIHHLIFVVEVEHNSLLRFNWELIS